MSDQPVDAPPPADDSAPLAPAEFVAADLPASEAPPRPWPAKWIALLVIVLVGAGVDQLTKHWASHDLRLVHGGRREVIAGYFALSYVPNPGAAWGFLAKRSPQFRRPFFISVSLVAMGFVLYLYVRLIHGQQLLMWALALVLSGAVGNFIDRLRYNYVVDFIDIYVKGRLKWPTFNVADIAITCGVLLLFLEMGLTAWAQRKRRTPLSP